MKFWSIGKFFIAGGIPLTASLGVWQLRRQEWKTQLIQKYEDRPVMAPLEGIPSDFLESDEYEFRRIKLSGHYDHTKELYIAPRSYIPTNHELKRRRVDSELTHSRLGVHIITAFELLNGKRILVNRGFASWEYQFPDKRLDGQIENNHEICGIIRVDDETLLDKKRKKNGVEGTYNLRDVTSMAKELNTLPIYIDLDREYSPKGGPVAGQTKFDLPNNHLLYAIHWFALSTIFTFILIRYSKKLK